MAQQAKQAKADPAANGEPKDPAKPICGVVRPISRVDPYPDGHWPEVHQIIEQAAAKAGFVARLVSEDEINGVILGRIVTNLSENPVVVCDLSSTNANVMFELGMRLTFDRPVIVIKDSITKYPFDASPIEYLEYPFDLRHGPLMAFQDVLAEKIERAAHSPDADGYRSFLKHFGPLKPGELGAEQSLDTTLVLEELRSLRALVRSRSTSLTPSRASGTGIVAAKPSGATQNTILILGTGLDNNKVFQNFLNARHYELTAVFQRDSETYEVRYMINPFSTSEDAAREIEAKAKELGAVSL